VSAHPVPAGSAPARAELLPVPSEEAFRNIVLDAEACIVFFDAAWCGACRSVAARLTSLVGGRGSPRLARVDVDALPGLSRRYGVAGVPTLILFARGQPASIKIGEIDEAGLLNWLEAV
jgi:thioredoxin